MMRVGVRGVYEMQSLRVEGRASMASISPNVNAKSEQLAIAAGAKQGSNAQPKRFHLTKQKTKTSQESPEESSVSPDSERLSAVPDSSGRRKMGSVRLRLARFGRKDAPFYRIHVAESRSPRDGKFLEKIGFYNPRAGKDGQKQIALNFERAKYWLSVGAQPSDVVRHLFFVAGLLPGSAVPEVPEKGS